MSETEVTLTAIQQAICEFRDARDWRQFHSPKNLSMSIAIEAAELMEHFQWLTTDEATHLARQQGTSWQAIVEELADVLIYCISLADILECDLNEIILDKLAKNRTKYPVGPDYGGLKR